LRFSLVILSLLFLSPSSWARWETFEEASFTENFERQQYRISADGTYVTKTERQVEILKESARSLGLTRLTFSSAASEFDLSEAYTLNGKEKLPVPGKQIEIKPLASRGQGFDEHKQLTIGYPQVSIGSKLYYAYELEQKKPAIPGLFYDHFSLGRNYLQEFEATYDSEVPLYFETHDPDNFLEVTSTSKDGAYQLKVRLKRPIYRRATEEEDSLSDRNSLVWVAVSTTKDWASFPRGTPAAYESVMHSPLPTAFENIRAEAAKEKSEVDQINAVTSRLAALVRYVGDWAPVEGAFHPRPLETVVATGFGDCKDFTSVTGAILSRLGFEVHAAWVQRARFATPSPLNKIAAPFFNHAILYAKKGGKEYWLDPTNLTSFAHGSYPDISGRPALLMLPDKPELRQIPPLKAEGSEVRVSMRITATKAGKIFGKGEYRLRDRASLYATGRGLSLSPARLKYVVMDWIHEPNQLKSWKLPDPDLSSRIVKDFTTSFEFEEKWRPMQTSAGTGYAFTRSPYVGTFQFPREERVSDLAVGDPGINRREYFLSGRGVLLRHNVKCQGSFPWLDFSREIKREKGGVRVIEQVKLKRGVVPVADIHTEEFGRLQQKLNECMQTAVAVFE
jgi:hypothetical protein